MTTLNTIIEEEKKEFETVFGENLGLDEPFNNCYVRLHVKPRLKDFLTSAMQRAVEYERARIRESFDDWFKNGTEDVEEWADRNLPTNQGQTSR